MFTRGDKVHVFGTDSTGRPVHKGEALVIAPGYVPHQYEVRFPKSDAPAQAYLHFVYPGPSQDDPAAYLAKQVAEYEELKEVL